VSSPLFFGVIHLSITLTFQELSPTESYQAWDRLHRAIVTVVGVGTVTVVVNIASWKALS
jgi:hypothetical protein